MKFGKSAKLHKKPESLVVGEVCDGNEIDDFSLLTPFSPKMEIEIFIAKYRQMTPQSTRNRMWIIFMILTGNNNEENLRNQ